jgi:DNA-binding helix-hairpin-helix protein with protein kinase domain
VHQCLPDEIRALFDRAFAHGGRASAFEWAGVLGSFASRSAGQMANCAEGHLQFSGKPCPTCYREAVIHGHVERQKRFLTQVKATPRRALKYVHKTIRGTHTSPFQAALAQGGFTFVQMTAPRSTREMIAAEILWVLGLIITIWWIK